MATFSDRSGLAGGVVRTLQFRESQALSECSDFSHSIESHLSSLCRIKDFDRFLSQHLLARVLIFCHGDPYGTASDDGITFPAWDQKLLFYPESFLFAHAPNINESAKNCRGDSPLIQTKGGMSDGSPTRM